MPKFIQSLYASNIQEITDFLINFKMGDIKVELKGINYYGENRELRKRLEQEHLKDKYTYTSYSTKH
jgi:hypothetical protein